MELKFFVLLIGIIILVLYHLFEAWGHYEFEPFAYKIGIIIKRITLKIKANSFAGFENNFYRMDNINYKFISNDTCLVRLGSKEIPLFMYIRPIPAFSYKIKIKNDKYVISIKISLLYCVIIGLLLYELILNHKGLNFNNLFGLIIYLLLFMFLIIFSRIKIKKVAINFIKIMKCSISMPPDKQ
jgi:hypothetical protein